MGTKKEVIVFQREGGRKLFLVAVQLRHEVGALASLSDRLEKGKFSILSGFISSPEGGPQGRCSFFVEATEGRPGPEDLKKAVEGSSYVRGVEVVEAHKGLITDTLNFPLAWNSGDRAIMLRSHFFAVMEEGIRSILATGADVVLYQMGYHHGEPTWRDLLRDYKVADVRDLQVALGYYGAVGWARPEVVSFDRAAKRAVVRLWDNFECAAKPERTPRGSNFFRGHLAGMFDVVYGTNSVNVVETKCLSMGDDCCEFSVSA